MLIIILKISFKICSRSQLAFSLKIFKFAWKKTFCYFLTIFTTTTQLFYFIFPAMRPNIWNFVAINLTYFSFYLYSKYNFVSTLIILEQLDDRMDSWIDRVSICIREKVQMDERARDHFLSECRLDWNFKDRISFYAEFI